MKFSEEFGDEFLRVELSNGHIIYGRIEKENEFSVVLKNAMIMYNNSELWKNKRVIVTKNRIVDVEEYDPKNLMDEVEKRYKNSLPTMELMLGSFTILFILFLIIVFG